MSAPLVPIFDVRDYEAQILRAADLLKSGKLVVIPTETVYGAAGIYVGMAAHLFPLPDIRRLVGMMMMGVVDTVMVGHISSVALAAVALGHLYFFGIGVFGMGTLMVLDPAMFYCHLHDIYDGNVLYDFAALELRRLDGWLRPFWWSYTDPCSS